MACDAQSVLNLLVTDKLPELSEYDALVCLAGVYGSLAGLNAQQAVSLAAVNGYHGLSERELWEIFIAATC